MYRYARNLLSYSTNKAVKPSDLSRCAEFRRLVLQPSGTVTPADFRSISHRTGETDAVLLAAGALDGEGVPGAVPGMTITKGQWHRIECLESGTVIFEAKDGPYEPIGPEDVLSM